jgi:glutaredoxin
MIDLIAALVICLAGCGSNENIEASADAGPSTATKALVVPADGGAGLIFTWIDEAGEHHPTADRSEIPEDRRRMVRVQDPSLPPGDPNTVWVADLTAAEGGRFPVRAMKRENFDQHARPTAPPTPAKRAPVTPPDQGAATTVVMYSTSSCPVCRQARQWLGSQGYSFVERNIERDSNAARELQEKAARQGVPANGVPVFEIKGRLIPGFNRQAITQALGS